MMLAERDTIFGESVAWFSTPWGELRAAGKNRVDKTVVYPGVKRKSRLRSAFLPPGLFPLAAAKPDDGPSRAQQQDVASPSCGRVSVRMGKKAPRRLSQQVPWTIRMDPRGKCTTEERQPPTP